MSEPRAIQPQPGPQEQWLASPADIAIMGGAAGGGKTWAMLVEPMRHVDNAGFGAVIFRRTSPQITNQGGMWDESQNLYPLFGAESRVQPMHRWIFPSGATVSFGHMQHEKNRLDWKGAQIPLIGFDQLEEFTESQFFYLTSRNRSTCGIRPYIRATANPVPPDDEIGGWLNRFIAWWIDQDTGYAIPERSGVLRWYVRFGDDIVWGASAQELHERFPEDVSPPGPRDPQDLRIPPKSVTFVPALLTDNQVLMRADPGYYANLMALPKIERERLLHGNWKIRATAGNVFDMSWFTVVRTRASQAARVRYWDKAGTEGGGAYTSGVLMARTPEGRYVIEDVVRGQWRAANRERVIKNTAKVDGPEVHIWVEQEPGSGGKESAEATIAGLAGYFARADRVTGDKVERAQPLSAQAEIGNVDVVRDDWTQGFLQHLHQFPDGQYLDDADAAAGAFNKLAEAHMAYEEVTEGVGGFAL